MPEQFIKILYLGVMLTPRFVTYIILLLVTAIMGLIVFKKQTAAIRVLSILVWITFLSEILTRIVSKMYGAGNPVYHIFIPVQILAYTSIYYQLFEGDKKPKRAILILAACILTLTICNTLFMQSVWSFPSYSTSLIALMVVCFALMSFFYMLKNPVNMPLTSQAAFWLNIGNLLFYPVTFFIFGLFNPFLKVFIILPEWQYILIWVMNLILYVCYFMALKTGIKNRFADA
jgi:hypothetical protein